LLYCQLLFLIRLAPYPYNVFNTLLSATHLSLKTFVGATALSLFKLMIHVWIGSKLSSFSAYYTFKGNKDVSITPINHQQEVLKVIMMIIGFGIGIGVIIFVWISAKKTIKEFEQEQGTSLNSDDDGSIDEEDKVIDEEKEMLTNNNNITTIRHRRGSSFCQVDFINANLFITNENDENHDGETGELHNYQSLRPIDVIEEEILNVF